MVAESDASWRARSNSSRKGVAATVELPLPLIVEASYKLGAALWHSRCHARLHGDLLLIERSGKQEAAVSLRGASVDFSAPSTVRVQTVSSPLLTLQLPSQDVARRWSLALSSGSKGIQGADDRLQALQGKLEHFRSLKASAAHTEAELERASRQVEQALAELRESEKKASAQRESMQAQLKLESEAKRKSEEQVRDLEAKLAAEIDARKATELKLNTEMDARIKATELKLNMETEARKSAEEQIQTLQAQMASELSALEQDVASESEARKLAEIRVRDLERSLSASEDKAASDHRRLAAAETRLTAESECRKASEENRVALEARLASAEHEIEVELARRLATDCRSCINETAGSLVATS